MSINFNDKKLLSAFSLIILLAITATIVEVPRSEDKGYEGVCDGCNVVLFSIEPLQKDHLGIYNYHRNTTPYLDKLAKNSTVFQNAYTTSGHTLPATASTLTSKYPSQHGVTTSNPVEERTLDNQKTLAEILKNEGYQTIAIDNRLGTRETVGLEKGFRKYKSIDEDSPHSEILGENIDEEEPFFAYVQSFQTHAPYSFNGISEERFRSLNWTEPVADEIINRRKSWIKLNNKENMSDMDMRDRVEDQYKPKFIQNESFREIETAAYDASVRESDEMVRNTIRELDRKGVRDDTIIIFMGQHGELLGEHDTVGHPTLYEEVINIPLLIHTPGLEKRDTDEIVSNLDIKPTIEHLIKGEPYSSEKEGESLLPLLSEGNEIERDLLYAEHYLRDNSYAVINPSEKLKYLEIPGKNENFFYNITGGNFEELNITSERERTVAEMKESYQNYLGNGDEELWPYLG